MCHTGTGTKHETVAFGQPVSAGAFVVTKNYMSASGGWVPAVTAPFWLFDTTAFECSILGKDPGCKRRSAYCIQVKNLYIFTVWRLGVTAVSQWNWLKISGKLLFTNTKATTVLFCDSIHNRMSYKAYKQKTIFAHSDLEFSKLDTGVLSSFENGLT